MFLKLLTSRAFNLPVISCSQALSTVVMLPRFIHVALRACPTRLGASQWSIITIDDYRKLWGEHEQAACLTFDELR